MLEYWYEIWKDKLITTSNLALNRAWRAKLPIVQTGDEFVTVENFDYAAQLAQFEPRAASLALKLGSLELCKRYDNPDLYEAAELGHLEIVKWIEPKWPDWKLNKIAAAFGHKHMVDWIIDQGQAHANMIVGAASHPEMFDYVWDRLADLRLNDNQLFIDALFLAALENKNNLAKVIEVGYKTSMSLKLLKNCFEFEHYDLFQYYAQFIEPSWDFYIVAKTRRAMEFLSHYVEPTEQVVDLLKYPSMEILEWLSNYCSIKPAWIHVENVAMAEFLDKICPPTSCNAFLVGICGAKSLPILKWFERHYPELINYGEILYVLLQRHQPEFTHYVRERAIIESRHLMAAIQSQNSVQIEWLLQRCAVPLDLLEHLPDSLDHWKLAFKYSLYKWPFSIQYLTFTIEWLSQDLLRWLRETGQLNES